MLHILCKKALWKRAQLLLQKSSKLCGSFYLQVVPPNTSPCVFLGFCGIAFLVKSSPSFPLGIIVIFPEYETTCCSQAAQQGKKSFHFAFGVDCIKLQRARPYTWRDSVERTRSEVCLYRAPSTDHKTFKWCRLRNSNDDPIEMTVGDNACCWPLRNKAACISVRSCGQTSQNKISHSHVSDR